MPTARTEDPGPANPEATTEGGRRRTALAVFAALWAVYLMNGDFLPGNDAVFSTHLPAILLKRGTFSVTPTGAPAMFVWDLRGPRGAARVKVERWDDRIGGVPLSRLRETGALTLVGPKYFLTESVRTKGDRGEHEYVNTFGPGPGLVALPAFAAVLAGSKDPTARPRDLWVAGKVVASALVAGSAALVYLTAARYLTRGRAVLVAAVYGLGTCVWSISSQALWQHGPNEFFLALGTYAFLRSPRRRVDAFGAGLAYALAFACRPTSALVVVAVGAYLAAADRRVLAAFCLGGLPVALALGGYNAHYHGSPFSLGRSDVDRRIAVRKTGSDGLWQTPLWVGAPGLLVSPSRGLLVYSPVIAFAFGGLVAAWRDPRYADLRPLSAAAVALFLLASKWFDWWGGWCFGYRPIVDTMPLMAVMLVPVVNGVVRRKGLRVAFAALLAWSVAVQFVGAFAYDAAGWNARVIGDSGRAVRADIDRPEFRRRLWSVADNPIFYYLAHFQTSRLNKAALMKTGLSG